MTLYLSPKISNNSGQALVETAISLLLVVSLISGFIIYIYQSSIVLWVDYHLNQAIECEASKPRQSKTYLEDKNSAKRHNRNCLVTAKYDIQKLTPWQKVSVRKNKDQKNYEVSVKWKNQKILKINAQSAKVSKNISLKIAEDHSQKKLPKADLLLPVY